jgi:adenylate kinase family enzyme
VSDEVALQRLEARGFPIHDEKEQQDRIDNFNNNLLPLLKAYAGLNKIFEVDTEDLPPNIIATKILEAI